jgi:hypothetical protein
MASGINRAPPRLNTQTNHTKLQEDAIPHQQPRTKKRKSRAKFPKQETIGRGPSGPLYSSAAPAPSLSQLPEYDVGGSIPLTLDYDIDNVPPIHIRLESDKLSRHARRKHAQAHRWSSTVLPSLIRPFMAFKRQGVRPTTSTSTGCSPCSCPYVRTLQVVCVFMDCMLQSASVFIPSR